MNNSSKILVPQIERQFKFKEKGSLFIAQIFPANSETAANDILTQTKKKYFDATHNCFAYRISPDKSKYSDDGEPKGSAGIRIYNAIIHYNLYNTIIIVTRYFGGTKLGIGPLGNAYYSSAGSVIDNSKIVEKHQYHSLKIITDFANSNFIYRILQEHKAINIQNNFDNKLIVSAFIKIELETKIKSIIQQSLSVNTKLEFGKEIQLL